MKSRLRPGDALRAFVRATGPGAPSSEEQLRALRQALSALGESARVESPPPLDALPADRVLSLAKALLESQLLEDPSWLSPDRFGLVLYEVTSALPTSSERLALGRRLLSHLYEATAPAFATVATRMASGSARALDAPALRARVHLLFALPPGCRVFSDALALTLVGRRELFERWVGGPSRGTLPQRRLAATLLERACREAFRAASQGDPGPLALLLQPWVRSTYRDLLSDREPLVWRHAAIARAWLAAVDRALREELDLQLDPALSPTEWRRAAVSLVACIAHDRDNALPQCRSLVHSELSQRHPALPATLLWGLPPVIEADPEAAEQILDFLSRLPHRDIAENMAALLSDLPNPDFAGAARERMRQTLTSSLAEASEGQRIAASLTLEQLQGREGSPTLPELVRRALMAFEASGAKAAHRAAQSALGKASGILAELRATPPGALRPLSHRRLSELDAGAVESARLYDLLLLGRRPGDPDASVSDMERLYDGFGAWLIDSDPEWGGAGSDPALERRRWLSLLHLIDVETASRCGTEEVAERLAWRINKAIVSLLQGLHRPEASPLRRVLCATLARAYDAAVREGIADLSDLLLLSLDQELAAGSAKAIIEASTSEEVRRALSAYQIFVTRETNSWEAPAAGEPAGVAVGQLLGEHPSARRFAAFSTGLHVRCSYRGEAFRRTLLRLSQALGAVERAGALSELSSPNPSPLEELEHSVGDLDQLLQSLRLRILRDLEPVSIRPQPGLLQDLVAEAVRREVPLEAPASEEAVTALCQGLPPALAEPLRQALARLPRLPCRSSEAARSSSRPRNSRALPDWLLPRRTIGSFYVVRPLGHGGTSSVFVTRRIEQRHDKSAELYALKVPVYDATVARNLSEQEFLQLFRQEAGALLALPRHENLAQFVSFDAEARPKPALVMELIGGQSLEDALREGGLSTRGVIDLLLGIVSGLAAMHDAGVGHLDVKPANVILRGSGTPVLVDFGLSGRQIRPGCGTLEYCAPEILSRQEAAASAPAACDVYALACLAFEALTGEFLIRGEDEKSIMCGHLEHDGWPPRLVDFAALPGAREVAMLLARCLRRDPKIRPSCKQLGKALALAAHGIEAAPWPLALNRPSLNARSA